MWRLKRDGAKKDEEGGGDKKTAKPEEKKSVSDHASEASDEALKRAAADEKAKPEIREAAKKELEKRGAERKAEKERIDANRTKGFISALQSLSGANKNNSSNNNGGGSISENDVKSFLTQKLGADDVTDELISGVMQIVNQHRAEMQKKNETINKIKQNAAESKEAKKEKSRRLKQILENGTDKHDSVFMSNNESYFKDVLSKYGFESFDDFEEWGANGADDDWDKYNKIFKTCFNKIPAEKFLKKSSFDELNSVSDLIEEIRNNR